MSHPENDKLIDDLIDNGIECKECKGHGFWWKTSCELELNAPFSKPEKVTCPDCNGNGLMRED